MNQKILLEIKKFEEKNKKRNRVKALPVSVLFTDRKKISDIKNTIKFLPKNSAIIIREYDLDKKNREIFALEISKIARVRGLKILIGKDIALAKKIKADGVHFSDSDKLPLQFLQKKSFYKKFIFSFSCHNFKSVLKAQKIKSDMIFISPIFSTTSHLHAKNIGIRNLAEISLKTKSNSYHEVNLYALGGISSANLLSVRKLGLSGFAAISLFSKNL